MRNRHLSRALLLAAAWAAGSSALAYDEPALVGGVYQIGTASELEWFADYVNSATEGNTQMLLAKAALTADIDMSGITHHPIGDSLSFKFNGEFDGQFHTISHLVVNTPDRDCVGLFGAVRGGTTIKNVVLDRTCSFTGKNRVGALIGLVQTNVQGDPLELLNCVSFATLTATGGVAASMAGAGAEQYPYFEIMNCVNGGAVSASGKGCAFCGWNKSAGGNAKLYNCLNIAEVQPLDGGNQLFRGGNRSVANCYDTRYTASNFQGEHPAYATADPLHSGELCHLLNTALRSDLTANPGIVSFKQDLSDPESIPLPSPDEAFTVYEVASYHCDGAPSGGVSYSNTPGSGAVPPHTFDPATGLCSFCSAPDEHFLSPQDDGYYHLSTPAQVEWFSHMVRDGGHGAMNVRLDADIDFGGVPDAHLPIGSDAHKYFGHFDGQGHRISGMVITTASRLANRGRDGAGFFGSLRGGGTDTDGKVNEEVVIENLVIDATCSVSHDQNQTAGLVARVNSRSSAASRVTIRNCGNEASVTSSGKNVAGILGSVDATNVRLVLRDLYNAGRVEGSSETASICGWTGQRNDSEVVADGLWNVGEVTGVDQNGYNMVRRNSAVTLGSRVYEMCAANGGSQGRSDLPADAVESGALAYALNGGRVDGRDVSPWRQTLGADARPTLDPARGVVNRITAAGYASQYIADCDVEVPAGVTASAGYVTGEGKLRLDPLEGKIKAGEAVILRGAEGYHSFLPTTGAEAAERNDLLGSVEPVVSDGSQYVLAQVGGAVGMYRLKAGDEVRPGKAYLSLAAGVRAYRFDEGGATAVRGAEARPGERDAVYNLAGQRVAAPRKGVCIVNGRKVLR